MTYRFISLSFTIILCAGLFPKVTQALAEGRIVLQVERHGEAWYVNPTDGLRYYLGRPEDAFTVMQELGIGITTEHFQRIATDPIFRQSLHGKILLQVEKNGEAWYVNPVTDQLYYLGKPGRAWKLMTQFGLGISNVDLARIPKGIPGEILPESVLLDIPFQSQAPQGDWSSPYNEACEEAILVMLNQAHTILDIVAWEIATYGYHEDTSAAVTARTAEEYLGLKTRVSQAVSLTTIKRALSKGRPVIVPVYGKVLGNPHYRHGGPYYHMILIIGYDGTDFITHDPGTMYGAYYRYHQTTLLNAIHDLTDPETAIATGQPAMVVVGD